MKHKQRRSSSSSLAVLSAVLLSIAVSVLAFDDAFADAPRHTFAFEPDYIQSFNHTYFENSGDPDVNTFSLERKSLMGYEMESADINNDGNPDLLVIAFEAWEGYEQDNDFNGTFNLFDFTCKEYLNDWWPSLGNGRPAPECNPNNVGNPTDNWNNTGFQAEYGLNYQQMFMHPATQYGKLHIFFLDESQEIIDTATLFMNNTATHGIGQYYNVPTNDYGLSQSGCLTDPTRNLDGFWDRDGDGFVDSFGPGNNTSFYDRVINAPYNYDSSPTHDDYKVQPNILARDVNNFEQVRYYGATNPGDPNSDHIIVLGASGYEYGGDGFDGGFESINYLANEITTGVVMIVKINKDGQVLDCVPINTPSEKIHNTGYVNPGFNTGNNSPVEPYLGWPLTLADINGDGTLDIIAGMDGNLNDNYYADASDCFDEWGNFLYSHMGSDHVDNCGNVTDLVVMFVKDDPSGVPDFFDNTPFITGNALIKGKDMGQTLEQNYLQYAETIRNADESIGTHAKIAVAHTRGNNDTPAALWVLNIDSDGTLKDDNPYNLINEHDVNQFECEPGVQCNLQTSGTNGNDDGFGRGFHVIEDLNGDGVNDFLVGSYFTDIDSPDHGRCGGDGTVYILYMSLADTVKGVQQIVPPYEQPCHSAANQFDKNLNRVNNWHNHLAFGGAGDYFGHSITVLNNTNGAATFAVGATQFDGPYQANYRSTAVNQIMNYPHAETGAIWIVEVPDTLPPAFNVTSPHVSGPQSIDYTIYLDTNDGSVKSTAHRHKSSSCQVSAHFDEFFLNY